MIKELMTEHLEPVMERLAKLEKAEEPTEAAEEPKAEEEPKEEPKEETEAKEEEEPKSEAKEEEKEEETSEAAEEPKAEEEDDTKAKQYDELVQRYAELEEKLKAMEKASVMAEAKVAELEADAVSKDAKNAVAADLADKPHLSSMSEKLEGLYVENRDLYNDIVSIKSDNSTLTSLSERTTRGVANMPKKAEDVYAAAHDLQNREGISYAEALERLS
jgi:hypothetical protein